MAKKVVAIIAFILTIIAVAPYLGILFRYILFLRGGVSLAEYITEELKSLIPWWVWAPPILIIIVLIIIAVTRRK